GQKCSATSRVLVHESRIDERAERMSGAVEGLSVVKSERRETYVPPLIDGDAKERLDAAAEQAASEGTVLARSDAPAGEHGWFVAPALVGGLPESSSLLDTELFGPLVTVEAVGDAEEALARIDALPFALTGGIHSRDPVTIRRFAD